MQSSLALFLVQAAIVIAASRGIGLAARRVGQPMVMAEVVAGILLGPSFLGWVWPGARNLVFPADSMPMLNTLSQVGLVLFMFVVGLRLDGSRLRGKARASLLISHSSIAVPCAMGALLGFYLYARVAPPGVRLASFILFMAVAMSVTAFPVLARILTDRGLIGTKVGAIVITCAAVDDVTAWCLLAFVVSFARATSSFAAVSTALLTAAYALGMVFVVRPVLRRLGRRADGLASQNRVSAVLLMLMASSWLTERIGIHAVFGGFFLGALVPKENGFAKALADKLEDFVVVFMLPLFFAYSGLRTQLGLVTGAGAWGLCALITLVASVGKFGGSAAAARLTGLSWRESSAIGILMNTRGLMELIVLNIGLDLGVISPTLFSMMVVMAVVTTFAASPLLQLVYRELHSNASKQEIDDAVPSVASAAK
jgi:Kef-type K+ transport system membrane component KefB